jgi:GNAT superfamily N-acetyltransferase
VNPPQSAIDDIVIEPYTGPRSTLRSLFELAEDSATELDFYLDAGRVLVARSGTDLLGHLQLVETDRPGQVELKNMAVREAVQGRGIGARLVRAAVDLAAAGSAVEMVVATATADVGILRFYQRQGFRFRSVQRDAFGPATGYPSGIVIDGIPLRDRLWLDRPVGPAPLHPGRSSRRRRFSGYVELRISGLEARCHPPGSGLRHAGTEKAHGFASIRTRCSTGRRRRRRSRLLLFLRRRDHDGREHRAGRQ